MDIAAALLQKREKMMHHSDTICRRVCVGKIVILLSVTGYGVGILNCRTHHGFD